MAYIMVDESDSDDGEFYEFWYDCIAGAHQTDTTSLTSTDDSLPEKETSHREPL